nr:discoidin domain-containing protein [Nakamurella aerolata]
MTWTSAAHPRAGAAGAFDGSNSYWSSAIASGAAGTMTLDLGRSYTLNRIGLSLRPQLPESATVAVSSDGSAFSTVHSVTNARSNALAYKDITPVTARYVRITVPATSGCDAGLASTCAFLNELELYSTVDGFENDPWGNLPRGADAGRPASQVWVTTDTSGGSTQALRLQDKSSTAQARISFAAAAAANRTLSFRLKPLSWAGNTSAGGFVFTLDSGSAAALQLAVYKDGTVHAFSGGGYSATLGTGRVALNAWSSVTLTRTGSSATISVNGAPAVTVPAASVPATVDGYTFASSGTEPNGDEVLVDDVEVR